MAPWIAWGPYLWADGVEPRSDGLVWLCEDVNPNDGIHPSQSGETKVADMLVEFFTESRFTGWLDQ
jgi:lysophospholipase L1-like esterase